MYCLFCCTFCPCFIWKGFCLYEQEGGGERSMMLLSVREGKVGEIIISFEESETTGGERKKWGVTDQRENQ